METVQDYFRSLIDFSGDVSDDLIHKPKKFRSIFISDFHLGTSVCLAGPLVQFLNHTESEYLYLVGDIIDCWKIGVHRPRKFGKLFTGKHYDQSQMTVLQKIVRKSRHGTKTIIIPGNHDEVLRDFVGNGYGNVAIFFDARHETKDGRYFLVMHGDSFDEIIRTYRQLSILGTQTYNVAAKFSLRVDQWRKNLRINHILEMLNLSSHWSLAEVIAAHTDDKTYSELYVRTMMGHLSSENAKIYSRRQHQPFHSREPYYSGIIGGHTHIPDELDFHSLIDDKTGQPMGPVTVKYINDGHWTGPPGEELDQSWWDAEQPSSCTAVVEYEDGTLGHVRWHPARGVVPFYPRSKFSFRISNLPIALPDLTPAAKQKKSKPLPVSARINVA